MRPSSHIRPKTFRWLAVGAALAWGVVEFLALQRSRYGTRRERA